MCEKSQNKTKQTDCCKPYSITPYRLACKPVLTFGPSYRPDTVTDKMKREVV